MDPIGQENAKRNALKIIMTKDNILTDTDCLVFERRKTGIGYLSSAQA
jgi:hypothetical protein